MFYRINQNQEIIDCAEVKYCEDCFETDKNIVTAFDGRLVFEEETKTAEYQKALGKYEIDKSISERVSVIKTRLSELSQDFIQVTVGAKFDDINERILEFQRLHNELRTLQGKEPRDYGSD